MYRTPRTSNRLKQDRSKIYKVPYNLQEDEEKENVNTYLYLSQIYSQGSTDKLNKEEALYRRITFEMMLGMYANSVKFNLNTYMAAFKDITKQYFNKINLTKHSLKRYIKFILKYYMSFPNNIYLYYGVLILLLSNCNDLIVPKQPAKLREDIGDMIAYDLTAPGLSYYIDELLKLYK